MIGKIRKGRSFGGCIRYVTQKDDAEIIASEGVLLGTAEEMARSFRWQCLLNPDVTKPVGHIALSFKPEDAPRLTDAFMARLAGEYLELMGIRNTQFIVVRHHGTDNPHCHIVFNRVDFDGKVISDSNDFRRNEKVTKMLKDKYSLTYSEGKQSVKTEKLHASERVKYEIYRAVKEALRSADTWKEFQNKLLKMGVEMEFKYKGNTNEVQGIRFIKNGLSFKGSGIDRSFSWSRLDAALDHNHVTSLENDVSQKQPYHEQSHGSVIDNLVEGKYSINSLVYWVTYVHNVVYSFYRSMIYCYINSTQRCAGSIVIDIIPTNGADKRKFFPFAPYFPVTNVIKRYFYPYFPAIIGIKGYSFPYFPYLSGIMKIKTALYSLFSRLDWHKTVVFPCLGEIYEGIRSLSWEIPVT